MRRATSLGFTHHASAIAAALWLIVAASSPAMAQVAAPGMPTPGWTYKTNFAIPDAPAFELLSVDPSTILRPQSTRELALSLARFQSADGSLTIPQAVALEFSPALLLRGDRLTHQGFVRHAGLYNLRVSLAALRAAGPRGGARLALGLRFTLADDSQLKPDEAYPAELGVTELTREALLVYSGAATRSASQAYDAGLPRDRAPVVLTSDEQSQLDAIAKEIRERWAKRYWNADRWEFAVAARGSAQDSTGREPKLDAFSLWITGTRGVKDWGQALVGLRLAVSRDSIVGDYRQESSLAVRFYAGHSKAKAYVEGQQTLREDRRSRLFANGGFEVAVAAWAWVNFTAGVERIGGGETHGVTSFKLKTAPPGL